MAGEFRITKQYLERWMDWYMNEKHDCAISDRRFENYVERRPMHVLKLVMVMNTFRRDGNKVIDLCDFEEALSLLHETEHTMGATFGGVGKAPHADVTNKIIIYLGDKKAVRRSELISYFLNDIHLHEMTSILETLLQGKAITMDYDDTGDPLVRFVFKSGMGPPTDDPL
jgi:hypothetical protein